MILPVVIFHLHVATVHLPVDDLRLSGKAAQRFFLDEDALNAVEQQWRGVWFEPWNGESKGMYSEDGPSR